MTVLLADISFGEGLLFIFEFFLLFAWIWILISIIGDLFRDHELSGVAKAVWVFFLVFLPFLGVLLYLIVRGNGMRDRTIKAQVEAKKEFDIIRPRTGPDRLSRGRTPQARRAEGKGRCRPRSSTGQSRSCLPECLRPQSLFPPVRRERAARGWRSFSRWRCSCSSSTPR